MTQPFIDKVVTANDLREGDVVYLTEAGDWTRHLAEAEVLQDETTAQARLAVGSGDVLKIIGAYLADVTSAETGPLPKHFREEFRRTGPSNSFHGKQESAENV